MKRSWMQYKLIVARATYREAPGVWADWHGFGVAPDEEDAGHRLAGPTSSLGRKFIYLEDIEGRGESAIDPNSGQDAEIDRIEAEAWEQRREALIKQLEQNLEGDQRAFWARFQLRANHDPSYTFAQAGRDLGWTTRRTKAVHVALLHRSDRLRKKMSD